MYYICICINMYFIIYFNRYVNIHMHFIIYLSYHAGYLCINTGHGLSSEPSERSPDLRALWSVLGPMLA